MANPPERPGGRPSTYELVLIVLMTCCVAGVMGVFAAMALGWS